MIANRLKRFLDENGVGYDVMHHDPAFTAQELAARLHVPGHEFVKAVVVKLDGSYALAALPAPRRINFKALAEGAGARKCKLASESEFQQLFPDCELGAMPPFGNLYNLPTYIDQELAHTELIVINAGTHSEAIRLRTADFTRLARPRTARFGEPLPVEVRARKKASRRKARRKLRPKKKAKAKRKAKPKPKARRKRKVRARKARGKKRARRKPARRKRPKRKSGKSRRRKGARRRRRR